MRLFGEKFRNAARFALLLAPFLCVTGAIAGQAPAPRLQAVPRPTPSAARRVLVKLRAPLAAEVEAALPLAPMLLSAGAVASPGIRDLMVRGSARTLRPLYPALVRAKKLRQVTDRQLVTEVQQRFAARARRLRAAFQPPELSRTYVLDLDAKAPDLPRILAALRADPSVEFAELDRTISVNFTPNDPYFSSYGTWGQAYDDLWGIKKIGAPAAWDITAGSGIVVAVVDTGIDYNHPDIAANVWINTKEIAGNGIDDDGNGYVDDVRGWNFFDNTNDPMDGFGHGTHIAGTIAAVGNNGIGVIGVAWQAKVMAVKGLSNSGYGFGSTLGPALVYAANNGADVISNSWGGQGDDPVIAEAIDYAYNLGAVIVAAAGNFDENTDEFGPANLWQVIAVAATDPSDTPASFSNWGNKVDVAAPGVDILSLQAAGTSIGTTVSPGYTRASGTSMAAPHVSGLAALLLAGHPEYSNEDVRQALRVSADALASGGSAQTYGYGRIDASAALAVAGVLEAKISDPSDGITAQAPVTVSGVARGKGFASYKLEVGSGSSPAAWTVLQTGTAPISGALGVFDASNVPNGLYTIRLTAYNAAGQAFTDAVQIVAAPVVISSPLSPYVPSAAPSVKPGVTVSIVGAAVSATFQQFQVEWAEGVNPAGWQTTGLTVTGGGSAPIANGVLATWATPPTAAADYYTIRLTVTAAAYTTSVTTMVYLQPDLLSANWPQPLDQGPFPSGGVVPVRNADGSLRLALAAFGLEAPNGALWMLPLDSPAQKTALPYLGNFFQAAAANLDGNPGDQVVVGDYGAVRVLHADGSLSSFAASGIDFMNWQVLAEDLEGDSRWETIALGSGLTNPGTYIYAWRPDGTLSGNFPVPIADQNQDMSGVIYPGRLRLLAGDVDGGGQKEIIVAEGLSQSTFTLGLFGHDGTPRTWSVPVLNGAPRAMAAADLDHNSKLETILVSFDGQQTWINVFQPDGSERAGWPVQLSGLVLDSPGFLAIGDLNRTGRDQILYSTFRSLYAFNDDGTALPSPWPLQTDGAPIAIGDIDGDGFPEIVTARTDVVSGYNDLKLVAFHSDGSVARSWSLTGGNGGVPGTPTPVIGDFNQDGITEIAVSYPLYSTTIAGVVTILTTGAPFNPSINDWPMAYQNARDTGALAGPVLPALFTLNASAAQTVSAGSAATYAISVMPSPVPYSYAVSFACSGLPLGAACGFSPASVTPGTAVATTTLTIATTSRIMAMATPRGGSGRPLFALWLGAGVLGLAGMAAAPRKGRRKVLAPLAILVVGAALAVGCGSSSGGSAPAGPQPNPRGTPAGTYAITVSATGNAGVVRATTVSLTVN